MVTGISTGALTAPFAFLGPDYDDDLKILYTTTNTSDIVRNDFNLTYIPSDFTEEPSEGFDPVYMGKLFERGYQMALDGYPWEKAPPGFILEP
jgi:hypothetical protein